MERALESGLARLQALRFDRRGALERSTVPSYAVLAVMTGFVIACVGLTSFTWDSAVLTPPALSLLGLFALANAVRGFGFKRLGSGIEAAALFSAISLVSALCATLLAATNFPLIDEALAQLDRQLFFGFERTPVVEWLMHREFLFRTTQAIYQSIMVQPQVLIAVLFGLGMAPRGWRLIFAWGLTLLLTLAVFPWFPALGSPPYFLDFMGTFHGSRDGSLRLLGEDALTGIITFPSFHAGAAVLLGWGFAAVPKVGRLFVALNALMFVSAIIGGHYLVDLVAGGLIATVALFVSHLTIGVIERRAGLAAPMPSGPGGSVRPRDSTPPSREGG